MSIQILLADDHGVIRAGLRALLEDFPDMTVVGEASDGAEAIAKAFRNKLRTEAVKLLPYGLGGLFS